MKREKLFAIMKDAIVGKRATYNLTRVSLVYDIKIKDKSWIVLTSYDVVVACYSPDRDICYVRNRFTPTTQKHVSKFITRYNPESTIYMYDRSDRVVVAHSNGTKFKAPSEMLAKMMKNDWDDMIEDIG